MLRSPLSWANYSSHFSFSFRAPGSKTPTFWRKFVFDHCLHRHRYFLVRLPRFSSAPLLFALARRPRICALGGFWFASFFWSLNSGHSCRVTPRRFLPMPKQQGTGHETSDVSPLSSGVALFAGGLHSRLSSFSLQVAGLFSHFREERHASRRPSRRIVTPSGCARATPAGLSDRRSRAINPRAAKRSSIAMAGSTRTKISSASRSRARWTLIAERGLPVRSGPNVKANQRAHRDPNAGAKSG